MVMQNAECRMQNDEVFSKADFIDAFRNYLQEREILTEKEKARLIKLGEESLPRYFDQRLSGEAPVIFRVEHPISTHINDTSNSLSTGIPIKGKIDRIDLAAPQSSVATIVDYKTGRPKTEKQIVDDGYYRQLVFYSLLLENGMPILDPQTYTLDFIGESTEHPIQRSFSITDDDKKELTIVIEKVWEKILSLDFTPIDDL